MAARNQEQEPQQQQGHALESSKAAGSATTFYVEGFGTVDRARAEELIYRHTHPDFRGMFDGERTLLVNGGARGSVLCRLEQLTDEEVRERLPYALRKEAAKRRGNGTAEEAN